MTTTVASTPMIAMTTIISTRVNPLWFRRAFINSSANLGEIRNREQDGRDDEAHEESQDDDQDRVEEVREPPRGDVDFLDEALRHLPEHLIEFARLLPDARDEADRGRKDRTALHAFGKAGAVHDLLLEPADIVGEERAAGRPSDDREGLSDRN